MDISWDDVRLFLAVVEAKSLSGAARSLQLGQPTMSRRIAELEDRLGYALFVRKAAGVALTPEAERLVAPARKMAEWAGEISRTAAGKRGAPEGVVRIAAAPGVAFDFLAPFAAWFRVRQPKIRLQLLTSVAYVDLVRGDADLAVRSRGSTSPDLKVVAKVDHEVGVFASKAYAAKLPKGYGFKDVDWIAWAPPFEQVPPNPQLEQLVPEFRPSFTSDNYLVQYRAAQLGVGAMPLGKLRHRFSKDPELVQLDLPLGQYGKAAMYLVCARSALDVPRIRVVAEALAKELASAGSAK